MSPQRISDNSRVGSFGCWRITGTGCVGDVEAGRPVWVLFVGNAVEIFFDKLLPPRESVAPAHWEIMAEKGGANPDSPAPDKAGVEVNHTKIYLLTLNC
jgi:hypothetical protein